jgi:hypothetical protein
VPEIPAGINDDGESGAIARLPACGYGRNIRHYFGLRFREYAGWRVIR